MRWPRAEASGAVGPSSGPLDSSDGWGKCQNWGGSLPLKLSGLGGLRAPFPGMTAPCILKGPVSAGMLRASRAAAATLQNLLVTLWLIYLAA